LRALQKKLFRGPGFYRERIKRTADDQFLFRGMIFCKGCGYALSPLNVGPHKYYFHTNNAGGKKLDRCFANLPIATIEEAVMREIFEMVSDVKRRKAAMEAAYKGLSESEAMREKVAREQKALKTILTQQDRLVEKVTKGVLSDEKIKNTMDRLEEQEQVHRNAIVELESQLMEVPTKEEIEAVARAVKIFPPGHKYAGKRYPDPKDMEDEINHSYLGSKKPLKEMTFQEKRDLLKLIFGYAEKTPGKMRKGVKTTKFVKGGIYVNRTPTGTWSYLIKGTMLGGDIVGDASPLKEVLIERTPSSSPGWSQTPDIRARAPQADRQGLEERTSKPHLLRISPRTLGLRI